MNFKHKGLQAFFLDGKSAKIRSNHIKKLRLILAKLNAAVNISDMNFPGSELHQLKGERKGFWSVSVNGSWRIIFCLENKNVYDVYDVDYLDYH